MDNNDQKRSLLQALMDNEKSGNSVAAKILAIRWELCAPDFTCPKCEKVLERSVGLMLTSPWVGHVRCQDSACDYKSSVASYLGKSMVQVEPLKIV